jgi:FkbM family methyltransferase
MRFLSSVLNFRFPRILHVGAHRGEEMYQYLETGNGLELITWIEAEEENCAVLEKLVENCKISHRQKVINSAIWSVEGKELDFYVASEGMSSSLMSPDEHLLMYPSITFSRGKKLVTTTLDQAVDGCEFDFLNLDIQGAELEALKGFQRGLKSISMIYCEVNRRSLYKNAARYQDVEAYLAKQGFKILGVVWTMQGWGDAIYVRNDVRLPYMRKLAFILLLWCLNQRFRFKWVLNFSYKKIRIIVSWNYQKFRVFLSNRPIGKSQDNS